MKFLLLGAAALVLAACGGNAQSFGGSGGASASGAGNPTSGAGTGSGGMSSASGAGGMSSATSTNSTAATMSSTASSSGSGGSCGTCPAGYTCGAANGLAVCRAASGIPLFANVTVIVMENTTLATLQSAEKANGAPNLAAMTTKYATGSNYHGIAHPSLGNYIAMAAGDTFGIGCDCKAQPGQGACNQITCNLLFGGCSCNQKGGSIADDLEAAKLSWGAFAEGMGTACNLMDNGNSSYAVRHVPFLYFDNIQTNAARCNAHVVDFTKYDAASPLAFNFIAPNLVHDMHDPFPASAQNIKNGDTWIGPMVDKITAAAAFGKGGLLVVVWDEDDASGGIGQTDDPIPVFVISPYARKGPFVSAMKADHYALLATIEDGLGLPRIGNAKKATPLTDYFPPM